jgi:hypothetical protein
MSLNRDDQKSVEAIRFRAQELAAGEQHEGTGDAEVLAALADGTVSFEDVPDGTLKCCVDEFGVDSVVEALMAVSGPATASGHQIRSREPVEVPVKSRDAVVPMAKALPIASVIAAWWRRHFKGHLVTRERVAQTAVHSPSARRIAFLPERSMIPAMVAVFAVLAIGGASWLIYESWEIHRHIRGALLTANDRPVRAPDIPQDADGGATPTTSPRPATTPAPNDGQVTGAGASASHNSDSTAPSDGPTTASHDPTITSTNDTPPATSHPVTTTGGVTATATGAAAIQKKVEPEYQPTSEKSDSTSHTAIPKNQPVASPGGVPTTMTSEHPYIAEYPHLGDSHPTDSRGVDVEAAAKKDVSGNSLRADIQRKLESEYQLTKTTDDKSDIVTAGSVLVLHKDKVLMVAATSAANPCMNTYKDGKVIAGKACGAGEKLRRFPGFSHVPGGGSAPATRNFVSGEKFWVTKIDVKDNGIVFDFFTDADDQGIRYKGALTIPFGALTPTPDEAVKLVAEVITVAPSEDKDAKADKGPAQAPASAEAPPAAIEAPPPPPVEVTVGQTPEQVVAMLGEPTKKAKVGTKDIYFYKDVKIIFINGRVSDIQ